MSDAGYAPESPIPTINLPRDTRDAATSSINLPPEHLGGWKFSPPPRVRFEFPRVFFPPRREISRDVDEV